MRILLVTTLAAFATAALAAVPAPRVSVASFDAVTKPYPYDEDASGMAALAKGRAEAKRTHKLLLVDLGGNWCLDCRLLAGTMELPEVKAFVAKHYVVVPVNVGRYDRNLDVQAHYGFTDRLEGVPSVLVVDPRTDKLVNAGHTTALTDARHLSPQGLADYLAQWAR